MTKSKRRLKKIKRYLEYFDKTRDAWIRVEDDNYTEEAMHIFDYIMAEIEIQCLIEDMKNKIETTEDKD